MLHEATRLCQDLSHCFASTRTYVQDGSAVTLQHFMDSTASETDSRYRYQYQPLQEGDIRLLKLSRPQDGPPHYKMVHVQHTRAQEHYVALSYCWGDPAVTDTIEVDGQLVGVAKNLAQLLRAFDFWSQTHVDAPPKIDSSTDEYIVGRLAEWLSDQERIRLGLYILSADAYSTNTHSTDIHPGTGAIYPESHYSAHLYFWVDAICIDQQNQAEKSVQVNRMWQIYKSAEEVVAWIGPEEAYTRRAFHTLIKVWEDESHNGFRNDGSNDESVEETRSDHAGDIQSVVALSHNDYFSRMWIVPEVVRARTVTLLSGSGPWYYSVPLSCLSLWRDKYEECLSRAADTLLDELESVVRGKANETVDVSPFDAFGQMLIRHSDRLCAEPRDKIFALKGLPHFDAKDHPTMVPLGGIYPNAEYLKTDYSMTTREVVVDVLRYWDALRRPRRVSADPYSSPRPGYLKHVLNILQNSLGIDCTSQDFFAWFRSRIEVSKLSRTHIFLTTTGVSIDCSGRLLQLLIEKADRTK